MTTLNFDNNRAIPVNKIVAAFIVQEDKRKVTIWLDGGFVATITCENADIAAATFTEIKEQLKKL